MALRWIVCLGMALGVVSPAAQADPLATGGETVDQAVCRLIETSARAHQLSVAFFTRLIWRESSFRPRVTSGAGAQGIAQFMPRTAAERGVADPFDPELAIPKAGELLAELTGRFGNLGLAAAAYNGGPTRVSDWLSGRGDLPLETRAYVLFITMRSADDWARQADRPAASEGNEADQSCLHQLAALRRPRDPVLGPPTLEAALGGPTLMAPWGAQLAGNFSKERALASFDSVKGRYAFLSEVPPMIIGTLLRSRGTRAFYRVRVPAESRQAANEICGKVRAAGGSCIVLRS